jgi:hypothetical protein
VVFVGQIAVGALWLGNQSGRMEALEDKLKERDTASGSTSERIRNLEEKVTRLEVLTALKELKPGKDASIDVPQGRAWAESIASSLPSEYTYEIAPSDYRETTSSLGQSSKAEMRTTAKETGILDGTYRGPVKLMIRRRVK